jgi:ABC-type transport system involved in cytochrome bd biosynthesis fused ATPase/permease subunit
MIFKENISQIKIQNIYLKPIFPLYSSFSNKCVLFSAQNDLNRLQTLFLLVFLFLGTLLMTFSSISCTVIHDV